MEEPIVENVDIAAVAEAIANYRKNQDKIPPSL
jgi:hypothetical protein